MPETPDVARFAVLIEEPYDEYWFHLGKFMHTFAQTEGVLLLLLRDISGLSEITAGVLFSGMRAEGARDTINNLLEATGQKEKRERLSKPFEQMKTIGTIRNNLVHWGAEIDKEKKITVSNTDRYPINPKSYTISINDFINMDMDLTLIHLLISSERNEPIVTVGGMDFFSSSPWRYRPPQPSPPAKKQHPDRPRSPPQRGASQKSRLPRGSGDA